MSEAVEGALDDGTLPPLSEPVTAWPEAAIAAATSKGRGRGHARFGRHGRG